MKRFFLSLGFIFLFAYANAQYIISPSAVKWYDLEKAFELNKEEPRPILIDVYSDWCSWCRFMIKTTFSNKKIANYINKYFYPVRFNAETQDTVVFQGKKYFNRNIGHHPTHDLATNLLDGQINYPTIVYFNIEGKKIIDAGYKEAKDIEPVLVYTNENLFDFLSLPEFRANFMYTFPEEFEKDHSIYKIPKELKPDTSGIVNWKKASEISFVRKKKSKPTILFFYADSCISCKVMEKTTFHNIAVSQILNKYFNIMQFNIFSEETINFAGKAYTGKENQVHEFAQNFLENNLRVPALVFLDANGKIISNLNSYLTVKELIPLLNLFIQKKNEQITSLDFLKTLNRTSSIPK